MTFVTYVHYTAIDIAKLFEAEKPGAMCRVIKCVRLQILESLNGPLHATKIGQKGAGKLTVVAYIGTARALVVGSGSWLDAH